MKNKITKTYKTLIILLLFLMFSSIINKVEANSAKFEISLGLNNSEIIKKEDLIVKGNTPNTYVELDLMIKTLTGKEEPLSSLGISVEQTAGFIRILRVDSITQEDDWGDNLAVWDTTGSSTTTSNSSIITLNESPGFQGLKIPTTITKIATIRFQVDITKIDENMTLDLIYDDAAYDKHTKKYNESDFIMKKMIIGNPQSGPDLSMNPVISYDSGKTALISQSGNEFIAKKTMNSNFKYSDTLDMYLQPFVAEDATLTVTKNGTTLIDEGNNKFEVGPLTADTILNVEVVNGSSSQTYKITIKVDSPSTTPLLKSLMTSSGKLSPVFEQNTFNYTIDLPFNNKSTNITFEKLADDLVVEATGLKSNYENGDKVYIKVTLPHNESISNTYVITLNIASASTNSELDRISLSAGNTNVTLFPSNLTYTLPANISNFNFVVHPLDDKATVKINNNVVKNISGSIDRGAEITYNIEITAENDVNKSLYTLVINRAKSSNTNITSIQITDGGKNYFINNVNDYETYYLQNSTGKFSIQVNTVTGENATVKSITRIKDGSNILNIANLQNEHIAAGEQFKILIEAEDKTTKEYILVIDKKSSENSITKYYIFDINDLAYFGKEGYPYEIKYNNSNYRYTLTMPFKATNRIEIDIESSDKSTIEISTKNPANLDIRKLEDNRISVVHIFSQNTEQIIIFSLRVISENGNAITYTFEIKREGAETEKKLNTFEIEGNPVLNFSNKTEGGTYQTIYIQPQALRDTEHTFSLLAESISENSKIRVTIDGTTYGPFTNLASLNYTITTRGKKYTVVVEVFSESSPDTAPNIYKVDIVFASDDITINNLSLKDLVLTLESDSDTFALYKANAVFSVKSTQLLFDTPNGANSKITLGAKDIWNLSVGYNEKSFTITSESERFSKTYTIQVEKATGRTFKDLDSLKLILNGEIAYEFILQPGITTYTYRIDDIYESFSLNATILQDKGATLTENQKVYQKTYSRAISSGTEESVTITVYDENNNAQNYFIKIIRANNNYDFEGVTIDGVTYSKSQFINGSGNLGGRLILDNVLYSKEYLEFYVNGMDSKATIIYPTLTKVESGKWQLKNSGSNNTLIFQIKAQDGSISKDYEVIVYKEAAKTNNQVLQLEISYIDQFGETIVKTYNNPALGQSFDEIVGKGTSNVVITIRLLKENRSKIDDFNLLSDDELNNYYIYQKTFTTDLININVRAENGDINTHTIRIHKLNNNDTISEIEIIGIENNIEFPPITVPTIYVREGTTPFVIRIHKDDRFARLVINGSILINDNQSYYDYIIDPTKLNTNANQISFKLQSEYNFENNIAIFGDEYKFIIYKEPMKTDNQLKSLEVNLNEDDLVNRLKNFIPTGTTFETIRLDTNQQSVVVKAYTLKNQYAKVLINGKEATSTINGENLIWKETVIFDSKEQNIKVTVIAEDKTKIKEYIIPINRQSDENTIELIVVSINGIPTTYNLFSNIINLGEVPYSTNEIEFEILRSDRFSTVYLNDRVQTIQNSTKEYVLKVNLADPNISTLNKFKIHLKSEYGTDGIPVNFEITRKKADTNTKLKDLEIINDGVNIFNNKITFSPNVNKYQFIIPTTNSNQIYVTANPDSNLSKAVLKFGAATLNNIQGENLTLESGLSAANVIEITVTSESGSTYTYTIYIYYALNNTNIGVLTITDNEGNGNILDVNFDSNNNFSANIDWDFGDTSTFNLTLEDEHASYKIIRLSDNQELNPNNITINEGINRFQIKVTSNYGLVENINYKVSEIEATTKTYNLTITKEKANRDTNLTELRLVNVSNNSTIPFDRDFDPFDTTNKIYQIKLKTKIEKVKIELTKKDHQIVEYETGEITLIYDNEDKINKVLTIIVKAQGIEEQYRIRITKGEDLSKDTSINDVIALKGPNQTYNYDFNTNDESNPLIIDSTENYIRVLKQALVDPNANIENDVIENIEPGKIVKLSFVVVAEDGITKQTYNFYVLRKELSNDNLLKTLEISANGVVYYTNLVNGKLNEIEEEINVTIPRDLRIVIISTSINDPKATGLQINDTKINSQSVNNHLVGLVTGRLNTITITVVAENGDIKVYRININLRDTSANIELSFELENKTKLNPNKEISEEGKLITYDLGTVNYKESILNIIANTGLNSYITVVGNGLKQLNIGRNEFIVTATSEDQATQITHKVIIERLAGDNNNKLKDLQLYVPLLNIYLNFEEGTFNENINNYTVNIPHDLDIKSVEVKALLNDNSKATLSGTGIHQLKEINGVLFAQINVIVTSEIGEENIYTIQIVKGGPSNPGNEPEPESNDTSIKNKFTVKGPNNSYTYNLNTNNELNPLVINSNENYIRIINVLNDSKAKLNNDLFENLIPGLNIISFTVIAENGDEENYDIYIYREELSSDNTLKSLIVRHNGVNYYEKTNNNVDEEINITLPRSAKEITITPVLNDSKAKKPQISDYILEEGKLNTITITVVAENGDIKVYRININLRDTSANIELSFELENKTKLNPNKEISEEGKLITYDLGTVNYKESILNIIANTGLNSYITVVGNGLKQLNIGRNEFIVTATSEDQATQITHRVIIERLDGDTNNYLKDLIVENKGIKLEFEEGKFDPNQNHYTINLLINQNFDRVLIKALLEDNSKATVTGAGELILKNKNGMIFEQVRIVVTSEVGEENIYLIEIIKASSQDASDDNSIKEIYIKGLATNKKYPYIIGNTEPIMIDKADEFVEIVVITNSNKAIITGQLIYKLVCNQLVNALVNVKSENLEYSNNYNILMIRESLNSDANISEIFINGELITVEENKFDYLYLVDSNTNKITIDITLPEGAKSNHQLPLIIDFNEGLKTIVFAITSEDNLTTNIYTLELRKNNYEVEIISISIDDLEIINNFKDLLLNLGTRIYQDSIFKIKAITKDNDAKVTISVNDKILTGIKELTYDASLDVGQNKIEIYAESSFGVSETYIIIIEREEPSTNNLLNDLLVINPNTNLVYPINFIPTTNKYILEINDVDNLPAIQINGIKGEVNQKIEGDGLINLSFSGNSGIISETIKVKVIAESGDINIYEIVITRNIQPETDISVNKLSLIGNNGINYLGTELNAHEEFISGVYEYNLVVPYEVERLILTVINNNGAEVSFVSGNGTYSLIGINKLKIEFYLTSKDTTTNNRNTPYIINITKEDPSDDNTLKELTINGELIKNFNPNKYYYELIVDSDQINEIIIDAKANNKYANINGLGTKQIFEFSDNVFTIRVTAQNGDIKDYIVNVKSQSNDNKISNIIVNGYNLNPTFNENTYIYTLDVEYDISVVEILVDAHQRAKVTNQGFIRLVEGINIIEVYATSESGIRGKIYTLKINRLPISNDNKLKSLVVKDAITLEVLEYQPIFNSEMLGYVIVLDKTSPTISIIIEAEANNKYATVGGLGFHNLENKLNNTEFGNIFNITVRAQNGDTRTYQLRVYKGIEGLESDSRVNGITLIGSDQVTYLGSKNTALNEFNSNKYNYNIKVPYGVTTITLNVNPVSQQATVFYLSSSIQSFNGLEELVFEFYVQSVIGTISEIYQIIVSREEPLSDNTLETIKIDNVSLENFNPHTNDYQINIPYNATNGKIKIDPIAKPGSKVTIQGEFGEKDLKKGKNIFPITVTSEDGKQNTYTIIIYHYNDNALLEELVITGEGENPNNYKINFNPYKFEYEIVISREDTAIIISATAQDQAAGIFGATRRELSGNQGDKFEVTVIAEDGVTTKTYTIRTIYNRELSNNTNIDIKFSNIPFTMFNGQLSYHIPLKDRIDNTQIIVLPEYENTKLEINVNGKVVTNNNINLEDNNNLITIKVTAEDGTVEFYSINIEKEPVQDVTFIILLILTFVLWFITIITFIIKRNKIKDKTFTDVIY